MALYRRLLAGQSDHSVTIASVGFLTNLAALLDSGQMISRRITGTSLKFQRKVAQAVKRARSLALLPYVTDLLK